MSPATRQAPGGSRGLRGRAWATGLHPEGAAGRHRPRRQPAEGPPGPPGRPRAPLRGPCRAGDYLRACRRRAAYDLIGRPKGPIGRSLKAIGRLSAGRSGHIGRLPAGQLTTTKNLLLEGKKPLLQSIGRPCGQLRGTGGDPERRRRRRHRAMSPRRSQPETRRQEHVFAVPGDPSVPDGFQRRGLRLAGVAGHPQLLAHDPRRPLLLAGPFRRLGRAAGREPSSRGDPPGPRGLPAPRELAQKARRHATFVVDPGEGAGGAPGVLRLVQKDQAPTVEPGRRARDAPPVAQAPRRHA